MIFSVKHVIYLSPRKTIGGESSTDTKRLIRRLVWRGDDGDLNLVILGFKRNSRAVQEVGMVGDWMLGKEGQAEGNALLASCRHGIIPHGREPGA